MSYRKVIVERFSDWKGEDFQLIPEPTASELMKIFLLKYTQQSTRARYIWSYLLGQNISRISINTEKYDDFLYHVQKLLSDESEHFIIGEYFNPSIIISSKNSKKTLEYIDEGYFDDFYICHPKFEWMAAFSHENWMYIYGGKLNK